MGIHAELFRPYRKAVAYDVVMPDVKYMGGLREMQRAAELFSHYGVPMSPHDPSAPIARAMSLHAGAALPPFDMTEMQFDESPVSALLVAQSPRIASASGPPAGDVLGAHSDPELAAKHADRVAREWHCA